MDAAAGATWRWQNGYFLAVFEGISIIVSKQYIRRFLFNDLVRKKKNLC